MRKQLGRFLSELSSSQLQENSPEPPSIIIQTTSECWIWLDLPKTIKCKPCNCDHLFCYPCLRSWVNVTNACPLWKITFKFIVKLNEDGSEDSREEVMDRKPQIDQIYFNAIEQSWYVCGRDDNEGQLLICDNCDTRVCHTYCDHLDVIPDTEWFWSSWRAGDREYNILGTFDINEFDLIEGQPSTVEFEEDKHYDSANDEEYDPNNDTLHSPYQEREERGYQTNSRKTFDDDFDDDDFSDNSNSWGYESTYYMRSGIATRLTRSSMRSSRSKRNKSLRLYDSEVQIPPKKLTKKRDVKIKSK